MIIRSIFWLVSGRAALARNAEKLEGPVFGGRGRRTGPLGEASLIDSHLLERKTSFGGSAFWQPLTNVTLFTVPQFFIDTTAPLSPRRFYRAVAP